MKNLTQKILYSYNYIIPILGLIILSDRLFLGKYAIHKTHDGFDSFIPYMNQIIEKVYSFELPGWNSDYLGGLPFNFMDINWLSLPVLIGGLLPFPLRMFLIEYIQVLIAGIGMYHFLEHNYKLKYNTKIILRRGRPHPLRKMGTSFHIFHFIFFRGRSQIMKIVS